MQAREFMTTTVATVQPGTPISDAGRMLLERDVTALPVVDADGGLVGIVSRSDLVRRRVLSDPRAHLIPVSGDDSEPPHSVRDVMTTDVVTLSPGSDEVEATKLMVEHRVKSIPVVSNGRPVGMVSVTDILRSRLRGDAEIEGDVRYRLEQFKAADEVWSVRVEDGEVMISGSALPEHRRVAVLLAETVPGVVRVRYVEDDQERQLPAETAPTDRRGLVVLGFEECLRRLASVPVGRLAFLVAGSPVVLPVNHKLDGTSVVFRTTWGSKLQAAGAAADVAFEVDSYATAARTGWSVLVRGKASLVYEAREVDRLEALGIRPWLSIDSQDGVWMRVRAEEVSGREIALL
jgi:CBS domain-containing protein/nitroimidazol reductase NimA-like FMN-containing flavoprotein (pyridoxamine 5'-phosphate oxidase superfamily)